ncbi:hypothetical protein TNCV_4220941 [Trichonephila clavipes]|nr:hypothetical protein TNCV_4220941 [Trichonephila clavipes]
MLNDDEIVSYVQAESGPVYDETDEDEKEKKKNVAGVHQMLARVLRYRKLWSGAQRFPSKRLTLGSRCEAMAVLNCPKPIPKVNLVPELSGIQHL